MVSLWMTSGRLSGIGSPQTQVSGLGREDCLDPRRHDEDYQLQSEGGTVLAGNIGVVDTRLSFIP